MSGIPVFSAGTSLQSSGASVSAQIPADSAGMLPLFVRVTATAAGYFRLSQDGASAAIGDLLVQPSDGLILKTCGLSQFSFVSQSGASTVTVTPIDVGGIKYPTNIFTPAALFTAGVNGAWYDPSDFSTMFQDAAGTTPVTAVEQPVGLMLDKSKGLVLGSELLPNGDFATSSGWIATNGVTIANGEAVFSSVSSASSLYASANLATTPGVWYQLQFTIKSRNAGSIGLRLASAGGTTPRSYSDPGTYVYRIAVGTASPSNNFVVFDATGFSGVVDDVSVKAIPGNHAYNPSGNSANFPVLQQDGTGRYYLSFNGVNQWLQTNSIDFTYGDKMFVAAGVRKLSDAAAGIFTELSANINTNNGAFYIAIPPTAGTFEFSSKGTTPVVVSRSGFAVPISAVVSLSSDIAAPKFDAKVNTIASATSTTTQGTGNYGNYPLYIGARAGSSLWFNGRLYGLVVAGKAASDSEIASTETWLNQKTGAY